MPSMNEKQRQHVDAILAAEAPENNKVINYTITNLIGAEIKPTYASLLGERKQREGVPGDNRDVLISALYVLECNKNIINQKDREVATDVLIKLLEHEIPKSEEIETAMKTIKEMAKTYYQQYEKQNLSFDEVMKKSEPEYIRQQANLFFAMSIRGEDENARKRDDGKRYDKRDVRAKFKGLLSDDIIEKLLKHASMIRPTLLDTDSKPEEETVKKPYIEAISKAFKEARSAGTDNGLIVKKISKMAAKHFSDQEAILDMRDGLLDAVSVLKRIERALGVKKSDPSKQR